MRADLSLRSRCGYFVWIAVWSGCTAGSDESRVLSVHSALHLEDHLERATLAGSEIPRDVPESMTWEFVNGQSGWQTLPHFNPEIPSPGLALIEDALQVELSEKHRDPRNKERLHGDIYVELPDLKRSDWGDVLVRARASSKMRSLALGFNLNTPGEVKEENKGTGPFPFWGDGVSVVSDGTVQTYRLRADWSPPHLGPFEGPWRELGLSVDAAEPASLEILSVSLVPKAAAYQEQAIGVRTENRGNALRRAIFAHAPARLGFPVQIPESARLDVGFGVLRDDIPVTFRVAATPSGQETVTLLEEIYEDGTQWAQRSIDLGRLAGSEVALSFEAEAETPGNVAFWAAPTIGTSSVGAAPNVIFYVLDGGGADYMSVYGYHRRTTPNLERLAAAGALFEHAYSNSSWSKPSTTSFMTSLHNSVLGNTRGQFDPLPVEAVTMAEHFHGAGYRTAVLTSNAWAGSMSNLDRGVDVLREHGVENDATSSTDLHQDFWDWRQSYPGSPYWVHFQTTDLHAEGEGQEPPAPFLHLFLSPGERDTFWDWHKRVAEEEGHDLWGTSWEKTGISRAEFFALQERSYAQNMAHQDYQLGRLVERLKAIGEWENTLLIVAADHSTWAGSDDLGLGVLGEIPELWVNSIMRPSISRVPLIFVWPEGIAGGQRFDMPVSMIDVLPTVLDLAGLPQPEVLQGQSLAPLLKGTAGWEPRPVIFDQFEIDRASGEVGGLIEVLDGRWGASLWIGPEITDPESWGWGLTAARPSPLLLFDLWNDPVCVAPANEDHPELVEKYTRFLRSQWEAHKMLAQQFTAGEDVVLTPEQLETLRSLGYIQ